jgi:hypothetical protein
MYINSRNPEWWPDTQSTAITTLMARSITIDFIEAHKIPKQVLKLSQQNIKLITINPLPNLKRCSHLYCIYAKWEI